MTTSRKRGGMTGRVVIMRRGRGMEKRGAVVQGPEAM